MKLSTSFLGNLPTLYNFYGREKNAAAEAGNLTEQKAMKKKVKEMSRGGTITLVFGVFQLLDSYSAARFSAQHLRFWC